MLTFNIWNNTRRIWLLVLACTVAPPVAITQPQWQDQVHEAAVLQQRGRYAEAERILLSVLRDVKPLGLIQGDLAVLLNGIGGLYLELGNYAEAERHLLQSLALADWDAEAQRSVWLDATNNLISLYTETRDLRRAERLGKQVLDRSEIELRPYPLHWAHTFHNLAGVYFHRKKYRQAETLLRQSMTVLEESSNAESAEFMYILVSMGSVSVQTRRFEEALTYLRRANQIGEKLFGRDHIVLVPAIIIESTAYRLMGRIVDAESRLQKVMAALSTEYQFKPLLGKAWDEYAQVLKHSGRKSESRQARERAQAIREELQRDNPARHRVDVNALRRAENQ